MPPAPAEYLSASSAAAPRAELQRGTVDFLVPSTYWAPVPPKRLIHSFIPVGVDSESHGRASLENKLIPINNPETATRSPAPMNYVFALDVSLEAVQSGFLASTCEILLDVLYGGVGGDTEDTTATSRSWWNPESKLAIVTFDRELCFYDFSVSFSLFIRFFTEDVVGNRPARGTASEDVGGFRH